MEYAPIDLPFDRESLAPHMSSETLSFHYDKHHAGYAAKLNSLIPEGERPGLPDLVVSARDAGNTVLAQNAAQLWNHDFFWQSLSADSAGPSGELLSAIDAAFGSLDEFKLAFKAAAMGVMGSGWAWLVANDGKLEIRTTGAAETVVGTGVTPLLTLDVWEHAYYIDYRNRRADFVGAFLGSIANWEFAASRLADAA